MTSSWQESNESSGTIILPWRNQLQANLTKWGNSIGLRIPKEIATRFGLSEGMQVDVDAEGERIVMSVNRPRYRLEDLLAGVAPEAMHEAFDWGPDVGREAVD